MAKVVFLSHAGADSQAASAVARELTGAGMEILFDREQLRIGDSFLSFMENSLTASDYCLLLWSRNAAATEWVRLEWEAALYRSIQEKRGFLVTARLEAVPLPAMIAPRLRVELFPSMQPGLGQVIEMWQADRDAETQTRRPVASTALVEPVSSDSATLYITSETFGITTPLKVHLEEPAGLCLDRIVEGFKLPKVFDHDGRIGVRFGYHLMSDERRIDRSQSLAAQFVKNKAVLWLQTTMTPYSQSDPQHGTLQPSVFRGSTSDPDEGRGTAVPGSITEQNMRLRNLARRSLLTAVARSGLGPA